MVMNAELFRLPFELLRESGGAIRCIIPSTKLSAGRVDRNRYYIDFMNLPRDREGDIIERLLTGLRIPPGARAVFEEEYARFKKLRFIGVGPSHGRMTYRLYAGFTDDGVAHESTASSVEWVPGGEDSFVFKRYDELGSIPRARKVALVRESLSLPEQPAGSGSEAEQVAEAVVAIIDKAFGDLMAFQVQETAGQRRSVVFNYYRVAHTTSQEVAAELERLFQIFNIDPADSEAWLRDTRLLRLTDISAGTGWDGRPFVTFYQGLLSEPPEFIEDVDVNENAITADTPSAIAVTSEGKMDTSTQIDQPSLAVARLEAVTPAGSHELCEKCAAAPAHAEPRAPHRPNRPQLVFALGQLGHEFVSEARRESFVQAGLKNPNDAAELLTFLERNPFGAEDVLWTLKLGATAIYVIRPLGAFAAEGYSRLRIYYAAQTNGTANQVSVPGWLGGNAMLRGSSPVPVLHPELRGMFNWLEGDILTALSKEQHSVRAGGADWVEPLRNLLVRLTFEMRNTGVSGRDRALNYAATNVFMTRDAVVEALSQQLHLEGVSVETSPFCPPDGECYDVVFTFFKPSQRLEQSRLAYRYTVDVSDTMPVLVDQPRRWWVY